MTRPRGEIREALAGAAMALASEQDAATWREIAARAQVGFDAAHETIRNMVRAGELVDVGGHKPPGSSRYFRLYQPATNFATATTGTPLDQVVRAWRSC